ncbi:MAG: hypothetical protein ACJA2W_003722 [Planctomycetota bacterium]|jgi:hypothetical protein
MRLHRVRSGSLAGSPLAVPLSAGVFTFGTAGAQALDPQLLQENDAASPHVTETATDRPDALFQYPGAPYEDRKGHLWFSTVMAGLVRFDGQAFRYFSKKEGLGACRG